MELFILAITTYNRKTYLERVVSGFLNTRSNESWELVIADDGSTDGTIEYVKNLHIPGVPITLIRNNRTGSHHQFNTIVKAIESKNFKICFKCDDDIEFSKAGWDALYDNAMQESGFQHLCYFNSRWNPSKILNPTVKKGQVEGRCLAPDVQGAFFTITPDIIKKTGFMDVESFGFRGVGHIDYTYRACRSGFNDVNHPFDAFGSEDYIQYQLLDYKPALEKALVYAIDNEQDVKRKWEIVKQNRIYIPYREPSFQLDLQAECTLLRARIKTLEDDKVWYENALKVNREWFDKQLLDMQNNHTALTLELEASSLQSEAQQKLIDKYAVVPGWLLKLVRFVRTVR